MSKHKTFWNKEYAQGTHLTLSERVAEDLVSFANWIGRNGEDFALTNKTNVLDIGCGNGRNLLYLNQQYGCHGIGTDISEEGLRQAQEVSKKSPITFIVHSITEPFDLPDASIDLVLDMMVSHVLRDNERVKFRGEMLRVLKLGGWFLFKTHLKDGDVHSERLLKKHGADEKNSYIHPRLKVYEHVWSEAEIRDFFGPHFEIIKILRSHKHLIHGRAGKRRTVSVYMRKPR